MITILVLDNSVYFTGAIDSIVGIANRLRGRFNFEFVMNGNSPAADFVRSKGFAVHDVRFVELNRSLRVLFYPFALVRSALQVRSIARRSGAALIHVNDIYNMAGLLAGRFPARIPVIHHVRLLRNSYLRPIYGTLSRIVKAGAQAIVAVSGSVLADMGAGPGIHVVHNGMSSEPMHPPKVYRALTSDCRFLYVGNYVRGKGHDVAIKAFSKVADRLPGSTLRFVGAGAAGELDLAFVGEIRKLAVDSGLGDRIAMDARVGDVEAAMKAADVVLNFSYSESFSKVCLEALTYGVPLISTDSGGPGELIEHEVTGLLIANGSCEEASEAMLRIAENPGLGRRLGTAAAARTPERFSIDAAANRVAQIYLDVLAK